MKFNSFEQPPITKKFEDFRGLDFSNRDFRDTPLDVLNTVDFDSQTQWPSGEKLPPGFDPEAILENSKNPGLGIRELHSQGITGEGIVVAIIDQKLDINHPEYSNAILDYEEIGKPDDEISMHGPAVASLLVGKNCGVAPGAKLVYKARPSGRNFSLQSQALNDIIERNKTATQNDKVRIVSCSIGYMLEKPEPGLDEWVETLKMAKESGIFVVDVSGDQVGVSFSGGGSPENKDDFDDYQPWLYENNENDELVIPSDYRTMASSWNKKGQYMYNVKGGMSWSVPYLVGLFALALQVNPNLVREEITEIINASAVVNKNGLRIVNPKGIVDLARESKKR